MTPMAPFPSESLANLTVYMVGIKGTGMAVLADYLAAHGARVSGSDLPDEFYTDRILRRAAVRVVEGFHARNVPEDADLVVYSAAYDPDTNEEIVAARNNGLPVLTYPEVLGALSQRCPSVGVSGVHGKTTTTMMIAAAVRALGLPGSVIAGGAPTESGGRAAVTQGNRFFVAETCEYRRHFLSFSPSILVVTSVEADHLDYFRDAADVEDAFVEYALRLCDGGELVYCADNAGAARVADRVAELRSDIVLVPYGFGAAGEGRVSDLSLGDGAVAFRCGDIAYTLRVPGEHNVLNAAAAALVTRRLATRYAADTGRSSATEPDIRGALAGFTGSRRRSELVGRANDIVILDDYAHHPTAIATTLNGYRRFYEGRRLVVDFMSHTYSRTRALAVEFGDALSVADVVVLHDIYASARETNPGGIDGSVLVEPTRAAATRRGTKCEVHYEADVMASLPLIESIIRPGDLFVTMGAGDNWRVGRALLEALG